MKLGEGGEAFFVFETSADIPEALQTSPVISPMASPQARPTSSSSENAAGDLPPLTLDSQPSNLCEPSSDRPPPFPMLSLDRRSKSDTGTLPLSRSYPDESTLSHLSDPPIKHTTLDAVNLMQNDRSMLQSSLKSSHSEEQASNRSTSPPPVTKDAALTRAKSLSKKLQNSNIPAQINDDGDLMLDMTGYKSSEEESLRAEYIARQILADELEGDYDIGSLIGPDEKGNIWIYSSEEAKEAASRKLPLYTGMATEGAVSTDTVSDQGYHSDDGRSHYGVKLNAERERRESDSAVSMISPPGSPDSISAAQEPSRNYAKTLRLTSDQLKALHLKPGANSMSFTVNRATCQANMYLWQHDVPIVVSDVDGTITKSDALGHVLNMIGRDWTHLGVAKLYSDIAANGYNLLYLTSRSVGQADSTRNYLNGISQEGYKLPKGAVIMSPDRTIAALRREVYLRKPEVFKMACLRDIMGLFARKSPFYAGFGNRATDALSYRSVSIPPTRIFTINSNAEVSLDLLSLNKYKTGYITMRETIDHFFPPVGMLVQEGGEEFTDFNYWRQAPLDIDEFSLSESEGDGDDDRDVRLPSRQGSRIQQVRRAASDDLEGSAGSDEEEEDVLSDDLNDSYLSRESMDDTLSSSPSGMRPSTDSAGSLGITRVSSGEMMMSIDDAADVLAEDMDNLDLIAEAAGQPGDGGGVRIRYAAGNAGRAAGRNG